jgi:catechol 2,3-dioxygenase-like lactoylglutathione lyase family enzyme
MIDNWNKDAVAAELKGRNILTTPAGDKGFWFKDPDGNEIGLFARDHMKRPAGAASAPRLWKAVSANHIVVMTQDYKKLAAWYKDLLDLRQTRDSGRDTYQWLGDSVWIPTQIREGGQTSAALKTLDHVAYSIEKFDKAAVEAELNRRNLQPRLDTDYSFNCVDINGFKTQVCDKELVVFAERRPPRGGE